MAEPGAASSRTRMGELLVRRGILTPEQLGQALEEQKKSGDFLGAILVSHGWASEEQVARALSEQVGLAYVDLASHPVEPAALELIPEEFCRQNQVVPLFAIQDSLTVAMANPLDTALVEKVQQITRRHVRAVFSTPSAIRRVLSQGKAPAPPPAGGQASSGWTGANQAGISFPPVAPPAPREVEAGIEPLSKLKEVASQAPVVQLVNELVDRAVQAGASDIHLEPWEDQFRCRYRIDGALQEQQQLPKGLQAAVISRIKIQASMDIAEKRLPQDGRIQLTAGGRLIDLRVSTFPTLHGENVVLRILDKQKGLQALDQLGFGKGVLEQFTQLIRRPHGIVLVVGPTGAGKTTTLYAALRQLNSAEKNIMTLEDPVEYELPGVRQSQVNLKAGLTFSTGLRSLVRQDPNIILIGEIRDKETTDIAIHASLTGHLVFSTLHTNDAASAAPRLVDMGVEPFLVATSMAGVMAQRLLRTLCPKCKTPYQPPEELRQRLGLEAASPGDTYFQENGCDPCRQTGYRGRVGIYELLIPNVRIRELITQKATASVITDEAIRCGMVTLRQDGLEKARQGKVSISEVLRVTGEND